MLLISLNLGSFKPFDRFSMVTLIFDSDGNVSFLREEMFVRTWSEEPRDYWSLK
jgi:hypothetical protein